MKRVFLVIMSVIILFGITACKTKPPVQTGNISDTAVFEDLNIKGEIMLTINNESGTEAEAMAPNAVATSFMRDYPGTRVVVQEIHRGQYPALIASGSIGDVFWVDEEDAHNYQSVHNALMPLDAYLKPMGIDTANIYSGALKSGYVDGRLYMAPRKLGQQVLIFNRSATTASGYNIPLESGMAWEDFKNMCKKLTADLDGDGEMDQVGAAFKVWWTPIWIAFAEGWGGKWCDTEYKTIALASDPLVVKGFQELIDAMAEGWLYPEDMNYPDGHAGLSSTDYIFRTFGAFTWLTRYGNEYDNARIDWDFCPFPVFPVHKVCAGSTGYVVYNRTQNPDTAAAFALYFMTESGQYAYHSQSGGSTPLLLSLAEDEFWRAKGTTWEDKNYDAFVSYPEATIPSTVISQAPAEIAELFSAGNMQSFFSGILSNRVALIDSLSSLERKANEKWQSML